MPKPISARTTAKTKFTQFAYVSEFHKQLEACLTEKAGPKKATRPKDYKPSAQDIIADVI